MKNKTNHTWLLAIAATAASVIGAQAAVTNLFANGGFETAGGSTPAAAWVGADAGYVRSNDARTGTFSASLTSPAFNAATMLQDSIANGGLAGVTPGDAPVLTFWSKGFAGTTANLTYQLRYLNSVGGILYNSGPVNFTNLINTTTWTQITPASPATVPAGATAAFLLFSQGLGPIDGVTLLGGTVLIDDVQLLGEAIPEPSSVALLGLGGVALLARRRRQA